MKTLQEWETYIKDHTDMYLGTINIKVSELNEYAEVIRKDMEKKLRQELTPKIIKDVMATTALHKK